MCYAFVSINCCIFSTKAYIWYGWLCYKINIFFCYIHHIHYTVCQYTHYTYCGLHSIFFLKLVFHFILNMVRKRYSQLNFSVENTEVFFYTELTRIQFKYYIQLKIKIKQWVEMKISFMKLFWRTYFVIFLFFEAFYYETVLVDTGWKVTDLCSVMEPTGRNLFKIYRNVSDRQNRQRIH